MWGPSFWATLHYVALGYPAKPTVAQRTAYGTFFESLPAVLPCGTCAVNLVRHLKGLDLESFLGSGDALFAWTVLLHNAVNRDLGKPEWQLEQALRHYMFPEQLAASSGPPGGARSGGGGGGGGRGGPRGGAGAATAVAVGVLVFLVLTVLVVLLLRRRSGY